MLSSVYSGSAIDSLVFMQPSDFTQCINEIETHRNEVPSQQPSTKQVSKFAVMQDSKLATQSMRRPPSINRGRANSTSKNLDSFVLNALDTTSSKFATYSANFHASGKIVSTFSFKLCFALLLAVAASILLCFGAGNISEIEKALVFVE